MDTQEPVRCCHQTGKCLFLFFLHLFYTLLYSSYMSALFLSPHFSMEKTSLAEVDVMQVTVIPAFICGGSWGCSQHLTYQKLGC